MATPSETSQVSSPTLPNIPVMKEGYLFKRQRGKSSNADLRTLKFQQRYVCLTQDALHYYVDEKVDQKIKEYYLFCVIWHFPTFLDRNLIKKDSFLLIA